MIGDLVMIVCSGDCVGWRLSGLTVWVLVTFSTNGWFVSTDVWVRVLFELFIICVRLFWSWVPLIP